MGIQGLKVNRVKGDLHFIVENSLAEFLSIFLSWDNLLLDVKIVDALSSITFG